MDVYCCILLGRWICTSVGINFMFDLNLLNFADRFDQIKNLLWKWCREETIWCFKKLSHHRSWGFREQQSSEWKSLFRINSFRGMLSQWSFSALGWSYVSCSSLLNTIILCLSSIWLWSLVSFVHHLYDSTVLVEYPSSTIYAGSAGLFI